jgi:hypothetical protein
VNQNHSLLLKFVHKLHEPDSIPWKNWYLSQHPGELSLHDADSFITRIVKTELPRYRAITTVVFKWMLNSTLVDTFPTLFSHCVQPDITVQAAFGVPLHEQLRPRLTNYAAEEKRMLHYCLLQITLSETPGTRSLSHRPHHPLNTREIMYALQLDEQPNPVAQRIWSTNIPKKVQFFRLLLHNGILNTRSSLYRRNIESWMSHIVNAVLEFWKTTITSSPSALVQEQSGPSLGPSIFLVIAGVRGSLGKNYVSWLQFISMSYFSSFGTSGRRAML